MIPTHPQPHTLSDFDFALPPELIAQHPASERSGSRLLDGRGAQPVDRVFRDLPSLLQPGDLLVFNDTRVIKARLLGVKASGGAVAPRASTKAEDSSSGRSTERHMAAMRLTSLTAGPTTVKSSRSSLPILP